MIDGLITSEEWIGKEKKTINKGLNGGLKVREIMLVYILLEASLLYF